MLRITSALQNVSTNTVVYTNCYPRSCNVGGVALDEFSIAIDSTRSPTDAREFRRDLEKYFQLPIEYLFLTHRHTDHRNGIPAFQDLTIVSRAKTSELMPKTVKWDKLNTLTFKDELVINGIDNEVKVELYRLGGHTAGSSILYFPNEKVVFAGDLVIEFVPVVAGMEKTFNPDEWIKALEFIKSLDVEKIVPGHSWFNKAHYAKSDLDQHTEVLIAFRSQVVGAIKNKIDLIDLDVPQSEFLDFLEAQIPTLPIKHQKRVIKQIESTKQ
ncbi:MAG: MBL fold metallo-hydrolase [Candidatus Thorarchaeota archaeon]